MANRVRVKKKKKNPLFKLFLMGVFLFCAFRMGSHYISGLLSITQGMYVDKDAYDTSVDDSGNQKKPVMYRGQDLQERLQTLAKNSDGYQYIYEHRSSYPQTILSSVCNNSEMLDFVKGYLKNQHKVYGGISTNEQNAKYPLLLQWDKRWGYADYGESCVGISGCAPTCVSMVSLMLTKNVSNTPNVVAKYAQNAGFYLKDTGTQWSFLTEGASHFGLHGQEISLSRQNVMGHLQEGHPIICSMRPGDFTAAGHFIVLAGVKDGKIVVLDPNSVKRSRKLWDYERIESQIKNLWSYAD